MNRERHEWLKRFGLLSGAVALGMLRSPRARAAPALTPRPMNVHMNVHMRRAPSHPPAAI